MGFFNFFGESKKLKKDNKKLMSDGLRHRSSLAAKHMNERKQELKSKKRK